MCQLAKSRKNLTLLTDSTKLYLPNWLWSFELCLKDEVDNSIAYVVPAQLDLKYILLRFALEFLTCCMNHTQDAA